MFKYLVITGICLFSSLVGRAQELQCEVVINSDMVQISDRRVFVELRNAVTNFLNNRNWTNQVYRPEERINCRLVITIREAPQIGSYAAVAQIVSSRPVYGTGYETLLMSIADQSWNFDYTEAQPLQFSENTYTSRLASLLSFYAYLIIGMDRDSFSPLGGNPLFDRALLVQNNVASQGLGDPSWLSSGDQRNRYFLLNNMQDPQMEGFRQAMYLYYRQGMDIFIQQPDKARANIMEAIRAIQRVAQLRPGSAVLRSFFDTKSEEIVSVFRGAQPAEKQAVVAVLSEIDPTNIAKYQGILQR